MLSEGRDPLLPIETYDQKWVHWLPLIGPRLSSLLFQIGMGRAPEVAEVAMAA